MEYSKFAKAFRSFAESFALLAEALEDDACALLARYGQPVEPEGWQLVPKVPTHEMIAAFVEQWYCHRQLIDDPQMDDAYQAMLAAAPKFGEE